MLLGLSPLLVLIISSILILGLLSFLVISIFDLFKDRAMRKELRALGVACDHLSGEKLRLFYAETLLQMIKEVRRT